MTSIEEKINELTFRINKHNENYYEKNSPVISDYEYDKLLKELIDIEEKYPEYRKQDSPTQRIGSDIITKFKQKSHRLEMKSLDNTYSKEEILNWYNKIHKIIPNEDIEFVIELKIDGLSVSMCYNNGVLDYALTRGNGKIGDDVTHNIKTIYEIPLQLKKTLFTKGFHEIRGEVYMKKSIFEKLNDERTEIGANPFANPRNAAAGSLKQLDANICKQRKLSIFCYSIGWTDAKIDSQISLLNELKKAGFIINENYKLCKNITEVIKQLDYFEELKNNLDYDIDGIVIKVNSFEQCAELGSTAKSPRYAIAYKYSADKAEAIIDSVDLQVGRTGIITPVANFKPPVSISGSIVSRATLHNFDYIDELDIKIKDTVLIKKAGEIIPKVTGVLNKKRTGNEISITRPEHCPVCNHTLHKFNEEIAIRCINPNCAAQIQERIFHFCSKKFGVDITIGDKTIEKLLKNKLISDMADLYFLTKEDILKINGFKDKSAGNLIKSIEKSKNSDFSKVLSGIGIPLVGPVTAQLISNEFINIDGLQEAGIDILTKIEGIGPLVAESIIKFFALEETAKIIKKFKETGLNLQTKKSDKKGPLKDLKFVITGKMPSGISRNDLSKIIIENGGETYDSISNSINYLISATKESNSNKFKKAIKLGIKIISEDDLNNMI